MIVFTVVVLPLIVIMHYTTRWKATKGLSDDEQRTLESLWEDSQRLESRLNALETILDDEIPDWRRRV
jgi:phage shock protein B